MQVRQPPCSMPRAALLRPNVPAAINHGISRPTAPSAPLLCRWRKGLPKHAGMPGRLRHRDCVARHVLAAAIVQGLGQRIPHLGQLQPRHAGAMGLQGCTLRRVAARRASFNWWWGSALAVGQCSLLACLQPSTGPALHT